MGVQTVKTGSYPAGTTTLGTTFTITETGPSAPSVATSTCTVTIGTGAADGSDSYCAGHFPGPGGIGPVEYFLIGAGDTVTVTQASVEPGMVIDPETITLVYEAPAVARPNTVVTPDADAMFTDPGIPPAAVDDTAATSTGGSVDIDVLGNDTAHAPVTGLTVSQAPQHGTAVVQSAPPAAARTQATPTVPAPSTIRYTPTPGFAGVDHFRYTITTANGTASALVTVTVAAPAPSAKDDVATTGAGRPVTVDVTANDDANYTGGVLTVAAVTPARHGAVRISGDKVVYTPASGFSGTDSFRYRVTTPYGAATATVTVTVVPAPTPTPTPTHTPRTPSTGPVASTGVPTETLLEAALALLGLGAAASAGGLRRRGRGRHAA